MNSYDSLSLAHILSSWTPETISQRFIELEPAYIAKQMTLAESFLFKNVRHRECLLETWSEKKGFQRDFWVRQPNGLKRLVDHTNAVGLWVADYLLTIDDLKERTNALKFFIDVAVVSFLP